MKIVYTKKSKKKKQPRGKCLIFVYKQKHMSKKFTENIRMTGEHMKRYSTSPVIEKIQNNEKLLFTFRLTKNIKD